jgi:hypothetical protein
LTITSETESIKLASVLKNMYYGNSMVYDSVPRDLVLLFPCGEATAIGQPSPAEDGSQNVLKD